MVPILIGHDRLLKLVSTTFLKIWSRPPLKIGHLSVCDFPLPHKTSRGGTAPVFCPHGGWELIPEGHRVPPRMGVGVAFASSAGSPSSGAASLQIADVAFWVWDCAMPATAAMAEHHAREPPGMPTALGCASLSCAALALS